MRRWWPPIAWAAFILIVSSTPGSSLPKTGVSDKIEHAGAYFVLAALTVRALQRLPGTRELLLTLVGLTLFAAVDEWHQALIPGRYPDVLDWVADSVGVIAGVAFATTVRGVLARRTSKLTA